MSRALTDAESIEYDAIKRRVLDEWKAGTHETVADFKAALARETAHLGTPIPEVLIAKAIRNHGHLGLGALNVAAEWTLARSRRPGSPRSYLDHEQPRRRTTPCARRGRRASTSRRVRSSSSSRGSPRSTDEGPLPLEDPPAFALYAHAARFCGDERVALWLEAWADELIDGADSREAAA